MIVLPSRCRLSRTRIGGALIGRARLLLALLALILSTLAAGDARAVTLLRDAETEHALDEIARPILTAAGLPARRIRVLVVSDLSLNAFVATPRAILLHAGLILRLKTVEQLQAVIAHEAAHIANGHITRRRQNVAWARNLAIAGVALGVAAGVASGEPGAGFGVAAGTSSSALRNLLAHTRAEEASADRSGLFYLARAGVPPEALGEVMEIFAGQEDIRGGPQDPYTRTHPLSRERLRAIRETTSNLNEPVIDQPTARYWFGRAQAKLGAYLRTPSDTFRRYPESDGTDAARIARAMAYHRQADLDTAVAITNQIIAERPADPYLHEMKGWMALAAGRTEQAVTDYAAAVELAPKEPLILAGYGKALLARDTPQTDAQALEVLSAARARDRYNAGLLRDLGVAHARAGQLGHAALATAERYALQGKLDDARVHAHRAAGQLPVGSPGWSRAQDIIRASERDGSRRSE